MLIRNSGYLIQSQQFHDCVLERHYLFNLLLKGSLRLNVEEKQRISFECIIYSILTEMKGILPSHLNEFYLIMSEVCEMKRRRRFY